jgi:hypothetical protein
MVFSTKLSPKSNITPHHSFGLGLKSLGDCLTGCSSRVIVGTMKKFYNFAFQKQRR